MTIRSLLIANRGEIAIRIARAAAELGHAARWRCTPRTTPRSLHTRKADEARALPGAGAGRLPRHRAARRRRPRSAGCDAVHPGLRLPEPRTPAFARALRRGRADLRRAARPRRWSCSATRPRRAALAERLRRAGAARASPAPIDARRGARPSSPRCGRGGAMMIKAVAGGGGRGMRVVRSRDELRRRLRALPLGGRGGVRRRRRVRRASCSPRARHIEVQIVGDGTGAVATCGSASAASSAATRSSIEIAPGARPARRAARARCSTPPCAWPRAVALPQPRHVRVPGRCRRRRDERVRLHRGQPAPAGRAHRHRGGDRRRPGAGAAAARRRRDAGRAGLAPGRRAGAARHRHPGAGQPGDDGRRRRGAARAAAC